MIPGNNEEILQRVTRSEVALESLMEMQKRTDQKIDTVLQMQIQIASMQESTRNHSEKLEKLFDADADKEKRIKVVESRLHWGKGVIAVIFAVIIPSTGWILSNAYSQISAIDRRLLGIEYQVQKPSQMGR